MRYQTAAELRGDLKRIKRGMESSRIRAASASGIAAVSSAKIPAQTAAQTMVPVDIKKAVINWRADLHRV